MIIKYFVAAAVVAGSGGPAFGAIGERRHRGLAARQLFERGRHLAPAGREGRRRRAVQPRPGLPPRPRRDDQPWRWRSNWFEKAAARATSMPQTTLGLLLFQNGDQARGAEMAEACRRGRANRARCWFTAPPCSMATASPRTRSAATPTSIAPLPRGCRPAKEMLDQLDKLMHAADRQKALAGRDAGQGRGPGAVRCKPPPKSPSADKPAKAPPPKKPTAKPTRSRRPSFDDATGDMTERQPQGREACAEASAGKDRNGSTGPASGGWRIQVGAFNDRASAEAALSQAGRQCRAGRPQAVYIPSGEFIRLRIGPFASQGQLLLRPAARLRVACFPVAPGK